MIRRDSRVFRTDGPPFDGAELLEALKLGPRTPSSRLYDTGGDLAVAVPSLAQTWRWRLTQRGEARVWAEAEGWLGLFFDPTSELRPLTWT